MGVVKVGEYEVSTSGTSVWSWIRRGLLGLFVLACLGVFFGSWYTVDEGERGVVLTNGSFTMISNPGLNFKMPYLQSVVPISIRTEAMQYKDVLTYSYDQQTAALTLTVNYSVPAGEVERIYKSYGSLEAAESRILNTRVYEAVKTVFGQFTAAKAIQSRADLNMKANEAVKAAVRGSGIEVSSVQIENIDFSDAYEQSVEARMLAEVEVQKKRQNAEKEKVDAEIAVTQANARADSQLAEATADAKAKILAGDAEAKAIRARGDAEADVIRAKSEALSASPNLVALTTAEKWDGKLPTQFVPGSTIPFINVK